jgi:outer membrane protein assembly factor BamB
VLAAGKDGTAYLLDRAHLGGVGGSIASTAACSSGFGTAAVQGTTVYLPCSDALVALRTDGDKLVAAWRHAGQSGPPIVAAGAVWVLDGDGTLNALDPASGQSRFSTRVAAPVSRFISPAAAGGRLVVPAGTRVSAFTLR